MLYPSEWQALWLTVKLALLSSFLLLLLTAPLAWWLSRGQSSGRNAINTLLTLPLVLPPTVLGFYLVLLLSPDSWFSQLLRLMGIEALAFRFEGLVLASMLYSLPFVVQPLQQGFGQIAQDLLQQSQALGANRWQLVAQLIWPLSRPALFSAFILSFAHTLGEFGIVLMIGGNIPGQTQLLSMLIYDQVESLNYARAHLLSGLLLLFSFSVLFWLYQQQRGPQQRVQLQRNQQ